jgi:hypothetical protein
MHRRVALSLRLIFCVLGLGRQGADLDEVVGQNAMPCPDSGSFGAVDAGAVPAVSAFESADAAFASGSPFHRFPECPTAFLGLSGLAGPALARNHDGAHTHLGHCCIEAKGVLAVHQAGRQDPSHALANRNKPDI